jgi:sugar transferase (PEP-CTERM system associated)
LLIRFLNTHFPTRTFVLGITEGCLVCLAFVASVLVRLGTEDGGAMLTDQRGFLKILFVTVAFVTCMYYFDLYESATLGNPREVLVRLIQALGVAYIGLGLLYYLYPQLRVGRGIFQIGFLFVGTIVLVWRKLFLVINGTTRLAERVLIFGEGVLAESLRHEIEARPELGIRVTIPARVSEISVSRNGQNTHNLSKRAASSTVTETEICEHLQLHRDIRNVDRIVVAMEERRGKLPVDVLFSLKNRGVQVQDGNEVYETITGKVSIESVRLSWLLFSPGCCASRRFSFYKRFSSVLVAIIGMIFSLPLLPFIALAIKLTSPGPVFYRQSRVGREGNVFVCYKFRTMRADAEVNIGATWAESRDPRITPIGKVLRKTRIDEIPQLWNVLKGDMALIGPRPERPEFVELLERRVPYYQLRHAVRPGITGWAQVRYRYGGSIEDAKEKLRYDLYYIKNMSAGFDLWIFFNTIKIILLGRGAR